MTRIEELTLKLMDGALTEPESEELRHLLEHDPEAVPVHVTLLEIEGELRGLRDTLDLGANVLDRLAQLRDQRIEKGVMDRIQTLGSKRPPITARRRGVAPPGSGFGPWGLAGLAAAALLIILFTVSSEKGKDSPPPRLTRQPVTKYDQPAVTPKQPTPSVEPRSPTVTPSSPDPAPQPLPTPAPPKPPPVMEQPTPTPKPEEPSRPRLPAETVVAIAELESVTGEVRLLAAGGPVPALTGQSVSTGQGIETGVTGRVVLKFPDGTRIRLMESGAVRQIDEARRILVTGGIVHAEVARQAPGQSVTFVTPQGDAKVLGTKLTLHVHPTWTRLEVQEGKVRLLRPEAPAGIDVGAGHFALAAPGVKLVARALPAVGAVSGFVLVNLDNGLPLAGFDPFPDNAVINLAALPTKNLNIRAYTAPGPVGSVRFELDGPLNSRIESAPPYELSSEFGRNPFLWPPAPGVHVLTATAFSGANGIGTAGGTYTLTFRVVDRK